MQPSQSSLTSCPMQQCVRSRHPCSLCQQRLRLAGWEAGCAVALRRTRLDQRSGTCQYWLSLELGRADTAVDRGRSNARFYLRDGLAWLLQFVESSVASLLAVYTCNPDLVHVTCHPLLTDTLEASLHSHPTSHSPSSTPLSCDRYRCYCLLAFRFHNAQCPRQAFLWSIYYHT
jgi:hypothetical protein